MSKIEQGMPNIHYVIQNIQLERMLNVESLTIAQRVMLEVKFEPCEELMSMDSLLIMSNLTEI